MKLFRFGERGHERPGVVFRDRALDVYGYVNDYTEDFFASSGIARLREYCETRGYDCPEVPDGARYGAPVARPSKIVCIGLNYRRHAAETGAELPSEPVVFLKATTALSGPNDDLVLPRGSKKTDWEVELAVVIGREARYVEPERALEYVAGYAVHNDYSEREFQLERGGQWDKGKGCDTFAPLGPYLVTADEVNVSSLELFLSVNGEHQQASNTGDMIFDVPTLISYVSSFMTLLPGDVISTGTPEGVGLGHHPPRFLAPGDVVECGISGLGIMRQRVRAWRPESA